MRERMHMTLGPVLRKREISTGTSTTVCAKGSRTPKQVGAWTLDLPEVPDELWAAIPVMTQNAVNGFATVGLPHCTSEVQVCAAFLGRLCYVIECGVGGQKYDATLSNAHVVGQPDIVVW
ncbi:hypothetical protein Ae201684P_017892 [Aphanomyces euteiches]|uniref:Uncharacterized protein n=1 Tax=Aphanomyces euteiches TaxID=100861 RepID=A0A6G0XMI9_9STRA|nr:hypothetical protein Ae201684_003349 [Aphanomyces euteiches]KAH9098681.1 hypothetical protein Ae201684P_017892 [Aphanomyces euteiches]